MTLADAHQVEVRLLLEAIYNRYGYDLRGYTPESMTRRVFAALARSGMAHLGEMQHRLLHDSEYFVALLSELTVQVSELFRDPALYRALRTKVVPILRTYPQIKVWHAGCAGGEEVYATAIMLHEERLYDRAQIYGTDLSASAIERARDGIYAMDRLELFSRNYEHAGGRGDLLDHCSVGYGRIAVREHLRQNIVFFPHNLVSDYSLGEMHVIFCRNVLIYFGAELRSRVVEMFSTGLCRGGFLCLGDSERLPDSASGVFSEFAAREKIYRYRTN